MNISFKQNRKLLIFFLEFQKILIYSFPFIYEIKIMEGNAAILWFIEIASSQVI